MAEFDADDSMRYAISGTRVKNRHLVIQWGDGHESRFHPVMLRHQCECEECGTPMDAIRGIRLHHIPDDIEPTIRSVTASAVEIDWKPVPHASRYEARFLRNSCPSASERRARKHVPKVWDGSLADKLPVADFGEFSDDPKAKLELFEAVHDYGFSKVVNVPDDSAQDFIDTFGFQRQTHYGSYVLGSKTSADNVGDNTMELPPHTDETYRFNLLGITVFQVFRPSNNGGHSTLVDGFEAVRRLRETHPDDIDLLASTPIRTQRLDRAHNSNGASKWYVSRLPFLRLDEDGDIAGIRLNERQISPLDIDEDWIGPVYAALKRLFAILYDPDLMLTFPLKAGEGLVFNNQRLLHGRTSYVAEGPARSVLTSSVDLEDFYSTHRLLKAELGYTGPDIRYAMGV